MGRFALEDPRNLPDLVGECGVAGSFLIGKASPPHRSTALALDEGGHFPRKPRLPDPGGAHDREEMGSPLAHCPFPDRLEERHLLLTPDQGSGRYRALGGCSDPRDGEPNSKPPAPFPPPQPSD